MEKLGREPDPDKAPLEIYHFPAEVQHSFSIHSLMPDRWDGMNGVYLGKDWSALGTLLDIHNIENKQVITYFIKYIEYYNAKQINDKQEKQRKAREKQSTPSKKMVTG